MNFKMIIFSVLAIFSCLTLILSLGNLFLYKPNDTNAVVRNNECGAFLHGSNKYTRRIVNIENECQSYQKTYTTMQTVYIYSADEIKTKFPRFGGFYRRMEARREDIIAIENFLDIRNSIYEVPDPNKNNLYDYLEIIIFYLSSIYEQINVCRIFGNFHEDAKKECYRRLKQSIHNSIGILIQKTDNLNDLQFSNRGKRIVLNLVSGIFRRIDESVNNCLSYMCCNLINTGDKTFKIEYNDDEKFSNILYTELSKQLSLNVTREAGILIRAKRATYNDTNKKLKLQYKKDEVMKTQETDKKAKKLEQNSISTDTIKNPKGSHGK